MPPRAMKWRFIAFIQFHLHLQLREAADYVQALGLILKGDMAIGVYPHSADVWQQPALFHTDMQAGAPPDAFAAKGQNWGFPTYNWPRMKQDGFDWWKRRLAQMSHYFDAFRIDHILGFFRIWSIPRHAVRRHSRLFCARHSGAGRTNSPRAASRLIMNDSSGHSSTTPCCAKYLASALEA